MKKETEIKIRIDQEKLENVEKHLVSLVNILPKWRFERTYGFFSSTSVKQGIFPRVKVKECDCIAGVKIKKQEDGKYFERDEYEFSMKNEEEAISFWQTLGFTKVRIFEKLRKTYKLKTVEICLDRLPFGIYIEIEGEKYEIEQMIKLLGLEKYLRISKAYLKIADELGMENAMFGELGGDKNESKN